MSAIEIKVEGADVLVRNLEKFEKEIRDGLGKAGEEAGQEIVGTKGLQNYPAKTEANAPGRYSLKTHRRMGYYERGRGYFSPSGKFYGTSENYGKQFYIKPGTKGTVIGNRASYAKYLAGEKTQAHFMAPYGWRILIEVAREKMAVITKIYDRWVEKIIKDLGL